MLKTDLYIGMDCIYNKEQQKIDKFDEQFDLDFLRKYAPPADLRLDHLYYLYKYASSLDNGALIVEIGTGNGTSAIAMAMGIKNTNKKIITIDPVLNLHNEYVVNEVYGVDLEHRLDNVMQFFKKANVDSYISLIADTSESLLNRWGNRLIDMLFIDGDHSYEGVCLDCRWLNFVKQNGIAVFDDWMVDVKKAAFRYFSEHLEWEMLTDSTRQPKGFPWKTVFWKN